MSKQLKADAAAHTITSDKDIYDHQTIDALRTSFARLHAGIDIFTQRDFLASDPLENVENTGLPSWLVCPSAFRYQSHSGVIDSVLHLSLEGSKNTSNFSARNEFQSRPPDCLLRAS